MSPKRIVVSDAQTKQEVLSELVELMGREPNMPTASQIMEAINAREEILSTGIGLGLAVPHVRIHGVTRLTIAVSLLRRPVSFASLDEKPAQLIVMVLAPPGSHRQYLRVLASIVRMIKDLHWREALMASRDPQDIYNRFCEIKASGDTLAG